MDQGFRREYLLRLPLPLAQLYSRAHNAKDNRTRHDNCFYIFESLIKLSTCPLIGSYLDDLKRGKPHVPAVDRALAHLALPSLGQWVGMLRELARHYGESETTRGHPLRLVWRQLTRKHNKNDSPGIVGLYQRIKHGPDNKLSADTTCTLLDLFDKLVRYRNDVVGHGGPRFDHFFDNEMGPLMFPAVNEVLAERTFEPMGPPGTRLVYMTEMRLIEEGKFEVSLRELIGLQGERSAPMTFDSDLADALSPRHGSFPGLALLWPGWSVPMRLGPMMRFRESEVADEVLLLNRDRGGRQVEYLSYTTGRTERDKEMAGAMAMILTAISDRQITEDDVRNFEKHSRSESESVEGLMGDSRLGHASATMLGDYELLAELGRGGMGVVYLARQASLGRVVALKTLPGDLTSNDRALARFRREMRVLGNCEHPNIVKLLDSGTLADGQMYYTMEYVPGADLEQVWKELSKSAADRDVTTLQGSALSLALREASRGKRQDVKTRYQRTMSPLGRRREDPEDEAIQLPPLPLPELPDALGSLDDQKHYVDRVAELIRDAARALHTVHEQGVIHRDVSPGNLMLTPDGQRIVLMDFGLAKGGDASQSVSIGAGFMGKLRYAAPEQLASAVLDVGAPADVRGLGATMWELVTRRRLFGDAGDERALATMIHQKDVPRLREIDPGFDRDLEAIIARATEREIDKRVQSAEELADYLDLYLVGAPLPIRPPTTNELFGRWVRRRKALVASVMALVVGLSVMLVWFYTELDKKAQEAYDAQQRAEEFGRRAQHNAEQARANAKKAQDNAELMDKALGSILNVVINSDAIRGQALYEPVRDTLEQLVQEYENILAQIDDDEIRVDLTLAKRLLAKTYLDIAESNRLSTGLLDGKAPEEAQVAERLGLEALSLLTDVPDRIDARYERAMIRRELGRAYMFRGRYQAGHSELTASIGMVNDFIESGLDLQISERQLLFSNAESLKLLGEVDLLLAEAEADEAVKQQYLVDALDSFGGAEAIWQVQFNEKQPDKDLASNLASVKLKIADTLQRQGNDAHMIYSNIVNNVLKQFVMKSDNEALVLTESMRLDLAIALRGYAVRQDPKTKYNALIRSVDLLSSLQAKNNRLRYEIEYAKSLLALASHNPLNDREQRDPEQAEPMREARKREFDLLFELLDRLLETNPDDKALQQLISEAQSEFARFQVAEEARSVGG